MENIEGLKLTALLQEYDSLATEKQIHKQAIRNIHVYLASLISAGITLLAFVGLPVDPSADPSSLRIVGNMLLAALVPGTLVVCAFGVNDFYQVYVISRHLAAIERRVDHILGTVQPGDLPLMSWEGTVCPQVFGGKMMTWRNRRGREKRARLLRPAVAGDVLAVIYLIPLLYFATARSFDWLATTVGTVFAALYLVLVVFSVVVLLVYFLFSVRVTFYDGPLTAIFDTLSPGNKSMKEVLRRDGDAAHPE